MLLSELIAPEGVKTISRTTSKKRVLQLLAEMAQDVYGLDSDAVARALIERETLGPTGVGRGVALPHARLPGLSRMCGAFVKLEHGVDFRAPDRKPVDLICALFAPEDDGVQHLKALAAVSRRMRDADLCNALRSNNEPAAIHALLTQSQAVRAA
ncbi:PTS sugar transporter subunit IIA [Palleronia caenipelagi]|uniref:PTS lactose transporter subunit IIC n=1 Tax=Palleronia caenipelagi TaxID=2489174 RepID=A0A547Q8E6_9RHOB|nr:PTS sugar transporter subunit IIA [Palleronia caenipelagi]TRD22633.1 PTS lactose transporter subunit IIC [Palleronia caenipelagi]